MNELNVYEIGFYYESAKDSRRSCDDQTFVPARNKREAKLVLNNRQRELGPKYAKYQAMRLKISYISQVEVPGFKVVARPLEQRLK
jgi:hypothetical protein